MEIAFYRGRGRGRWFDRLVQWWTRGPYSHAELILERQGDRALCASSSWLDDGVRLKWIDLAPARWDIVAVPADAVAAEVWFLAHIGQRYDVLGLLGFVWRPAADDRRRWFCSEAVAAALGWDDPWRFDPSTLATVARSMEREIK